MKIYSKLSKKNAVEFILAHLPNSGMNLLVFVKHTEWNCAPFDEYAKQNSAYSPNIQSYLKFDYAKNETIIKNISGR